MSLDIGKKDLVNRKGFGSADSVNIPSVTSRAGETEPGVFGSLEPESLEKKKREPEPLGKKKSGAGARAAKK